MGISEEKVGAGSRANLGQTAACSPGAEPEKMPTDPYDPTHVVALRTTSEIEAGNVQVVGVLLSRVPIRTVSRWGGTQQYEERIHTESW